MKNWEDKLIILNNKGKLKRSKLFIDAQLTKKPNAERTEHKVTKMTMEKCTTWWNNEIKIEIQKKLWKLHRNNKRDRNYNEYKMHRTRVKEVVKKAKII